MLGLCMALGNAVHAANEAHRHGVTLPQAQAVVAELDTPAARATGDDVLWYVYVANADKRISSNKLAALVRKACIIRTGENNGR